MCVPVSGGVLWCFVACVMRGVYEVTEGSHILVISCGAPLVYCTGVATSVRKPHGKGFQRVPEDPTMHRV